MLEVTFRDRFQPRWQRGTRGRCVAEGHPRVDEGPVEANVGPLDPLEDQELISLAPDV